MSHSTVIKGCIIMLHSTVGWGGINEKESKF